jgi:cell division protein FtsI (penicillin-binding protein 3)
VPPKEISDKLASGKSFVWIERRIPLENGNAIAEAKIKGVQVEHEFRRYYPNKELAGHVLGAVGYDAKALGGLEMAYDQYLKSESQLTQAERDARGKLFTLRDSVDVNHDIHLSLDKNIQYFTEAALTENAVKHGVKNGFAIVMDVRTGDILAMANFPEFNPNSYWSYPQDQWKNHAVIDTFEPGSTFKSILMAAALASGKVNSHDRFNCEGGHLRIGKHTIKDHGGSGYGMLSALEILQVSSNIGVTKIAYKIGKEEFYNFIIKLGFGEKTGIGLIGEASGFVRRNFKAWKDIEFSNIAFGQGIAVTGLQMVSAYASFANDGVQMKPRLLKKIVSSKGETLIEEKSTERTRVLSPESSKSLREMLFAVTQPGGTAIAANVEGYFSGGKTGTAQKVDPETRTYATNQYVSSFVGFAPLEKPEIAVYVVYDTPRKNGYYGGVVAAPIFKKISAQTLAYLGVTPDADGVPPFKLATKTSTPIPAAKKDSEKMIIVKQRKDLEAIKSALAEKRMPDLEGLSLRAVLKLSREHQVKVNVDGSGYVVKQTPRANEKLAEEWKLILGGSS